MTPAKGDTIHMLATVIEISESFRSLPVHVSIGDGSRTFWIAEKDIVHVEPRPIAVGDTVREKNTTYPHGDVIAIVDSHAWCRSSGYDYIVEVEKLERVP